MLRIAIWQHYACLGALIYEHALRTETPSDVYARLLQNYSAAPTSRTIFTNTCINLTNRETKQAFADQMDELVSQKEAEA